jgi:hypothetical protein
MAHLLRPARYNNFTEAARFHTLFQPAARRSDFSSDLAGLIADQDPWIGGLVPDQVLIGVFASRAFVDAQIVACRCRFDPAQAQLPAAIGARRRRRLGRRQARGMASPAFPLLIQRQFLLAHPENTRWPPLSFKKFPWWQVRRRSFHPISLCDEFLRMGRKFATAEDVINWPPILLVVEDGGFQRAFL